MPHVTMREAKCTDMIIGMTSGPTGFVGKCATAQHDKRWQADPGDRWRHVPTHLCQRSIFTHVVTVEWTAVCGRRALRREGGRSSLALVMRYRKSIKSLSPPCIKQKGNFIIYHRLIRDHSQFQSSNQNTQVSLFIEYAFIQT